jgi:hypothetical protein
MLRSSTAFRPVLVDRVVNRTITLVCVLIVYDGWANAIIWIEALSIGFWAGLAARRAGLHGSSLALAVLAGLIVSAIVLAPSAGEGG